ncbi:MAG TPA: bidirectional hydrogenase complex protein HoxE [Kiritimatiellia bacterium]|nr:bidirectional hydrogenase complex protein HoxE [Kiritimatiellia bacterium]HMO99989.1 bidirectional hydrogenase complex protein HoxE [Kiritimatiellia bacterium]HMP98113.1 bidirectional hydrogenase complex protein HoxE [Kiritimatiellia bacterium]
MSAPAKPAPLTNEEKRWRLVEVVMRRYGFSGDALIEALHAVQETYGFIDEESMRKVAVALNLPLSKVYGVATFYHFFHLKPKGRHTCVVCMGTACYIKGADAIMQKLAAEFGIKDGETTPDDHLSVMTARCVGSCGLAPAIVLDQQVLGHIGPDQIVQHIKELES